MALVNSMFLAGCASVRGPARLARLQEAPTVEPANQSWVAVPAGSLLQVDLRTGDSIEGRFDSADDQELVLEQDGAIRSVPRAEIQRVAIIRGTDAGTGALFGLSIGGVIMFIQSSGGDLSVGGSFLWALIGGGIGAGIGALFGFLSRTLEVIYESPVPGATN